MTCSRCNGLRVPDLDLAAPPMCDYCVNCGERYFERAVRIDRGEIAPVKCRNAYMRDYMRRKRHLERLGAHP